MVSTLKRFHLVITAATFLAITFSLLNACQPNVTPPTLTVTTRVEPSITLTPTHKPFPTDRPSQTPSPTSVPSLTPGPSPTSTPVPPLDGHTWQPAPVLVQAAQRDLNSRSPINLSPFFVLYADGRLILQQCKAGECQVVSQQLKPQETCQLLNTIDQLGFFDYDPATYQSPQGGGQSLLIQVNAWRSKTVELDGLARWIEDPNWFDLQHQCSQCVPRPVILPALADTYALLTRYHPTNTTPYQAEQLAVWVGQPWAEGNAEPWLLNTISLNDLYSRSRCPDPTQSQAVILSGDPAVQLAEYINTAMTHLNAPIFFEDPLKLQIQTRWLLPLEAAPGCGEKSNSLPQVNAPTPSFTLSCKPSDGTLPIPTATPLPRQP